MTTDKREGPVTSRDVARAAGVSQSAVSRAFARAPGVSEPTRARILKVAAGLGYQPNALASGLITRKSGMVGVVLSQLSNPFLAEATQFLFDALRRKGLHVLAFAAGSGRDLEAATSEFGRYRVDGCFVVSPHLPRDTARMYDRLGPTVILFNRKVPGLDASAVCVDNISGGRLVAEHLIRRGHESFGYVHGIPGAATDTDRFKGFCAAIANAGLSKPVEAAGAYGYADGVRAAHLLLAGDNRPTALFCADDAMAMGAMDTARHALGLRVPEDIAIVGFDDATSASWPSYDLTTVRQPAEAMVAAAVEMMVAGNGQRPTTRTFPTELVVRGSA